MVSKKNGVRRLSTGFKVLIMLCALISLVVWSVPGFAAGRLRVSVLDFSGNVSDNLKQAANNKVTKVLVDLGRFELVERAEIDKILEEQHLQSTGLIDQSMAVEIGKVLAVDVAFIGSIEYLTTTYDSKYKTYSTEARVTVKIIDVQSGKIIHMIESNGYASDSVRDNSQLLALEDCFSMFFVGEIRDTFAISTSVLRIRDKYIYFLNGEDIGVKKGTRFYVYRPDNEDLQDLELGEADTFKRKIGLIEVIDITENLGKAKVVWSSNTIKEGDYLQEVAMTIRPTFNFAVTTSDIKMSDQSGMEWNGSAYVLEARMGLEKPLVNGTNLVGGYVHINDQNTNNSINGGTDIFNLGLDKTIEVPIFRGRLNAILGGGGGISFGFQDFERPIYPETGSASGISWYAAGFTGLKYYFAHDRGISLEVSFNGQYGPHFSSWNEQLDEGIGGVVSDYVEYPRLNLSGFGWRFGINFPLNLDQIF